MYVHIHVLVYVFLLCSLTFCFRNFIFIFLSTKIFSYLFFSKWKTGNPPSWKYTRFVKCYQFVNKRMKVYLHEFVEMRVLKPDLCIINSAISTFASSGEKLWEKHKTFFTKIKIDIKHTTKQKLPQTWYIHRDTSLLRNTFSITT